MTPTSSGSSAVAATESFLAAYDEVLAVRWPAGTTHSEALTPYGTTRVNSYGPEDAPPLMLLVEAVAPRPPSGTPRPPTWAAVTASTPSTSWATRAAAWWGSVRSVRCRT